MPIIDHTPAPETISHIRPGVRIEFNFASQLHALVEFSIFNDPRFTSWERMLSIAPEPKITYLQPSELTLIRGENKSQLPPPKQYIERAIINHLFKFSGIYGLLRKLDGEHTDQIDRVVSI